MESTISSNDYLLSKTHVVSVAVDITHVGNAAPPAKPIKIMFRRDALLRVRVAL